MAEELKEEEMSELKLFIWTNFDSDYTPGLAFAIAEDVTEAKKLIEEMRKKDTPYYKVYDWGSLEIRPLTEKIAREVSGGS